MRPSSVLTQNTNTPLKGTWPDALRRFDGWLHARGMAEKTRRAYGVDLEQLARFAGEREARELTHNDLRRFAGFLSEAGMSKSAVARKLAAIRTFYRHLVEIGEVTASPADLVSSPKRDTYLPHVLKPAEVAALLDPIPASTPLALRHACASPVVGSWSALRASQELLRPAWSRKRQRSSAAESGRRKKAYALGHPRACPHGSAGAELDTNAKAIGLTEMGWPYKDS